MRKGFALITVLAVLIMIAIGTATVLYSVGSHTSMKSNSYRDLRAQYLAEAGMQHALWVCRANNGNCAPANNMTLNTEEWPIVITTDPTTPNTPPYEIRVTVDYPNV